LLNTKHLTQLLLFLLFSASTLFAQDRAVAIVYDNSASMIGEQCEAVNYSLQVLVGIINPKDELYVNTMTVCEGFTSQQVRDKGQTEPEFILKNACRFDNLLSEKAKSLETIQDINCTYYNPFPPVRDVMEKLQRSDKKEKWLIFLTDGEWVDDMKREEEAELEEFINKSGVQVIYLNIDPSEADPNNNLKKALKRITGNNPLQTKGQPDKIIKSLETASAQVMGIPDEGLKSTRNGNTITLDCKVPLKRLILLDQESTSSNPPPKITTVTVNGEVVYVHPTLIAKNAKTKGYITEIGYQEYENKLIPAGKIKVEFAGDIGSRKLKFLPEVAAKLNAYPKADFKQKPSKNANFYVICEDKNKVLIVGQIVGLDNKPLESIKSEDVNMKAIVGNNRMNMIYVDSMKAWVKEYQVNKREVKFSVSAQYTGYFNYLSNIITVKTDTCVSLTSGLKAEKQLLKVKVTDLKNSPVMKVYPEIIEKPSNNRRKPTAEEFQRMYVEKVNSNRISIDVDRKDGYWEVRPAPYICACFTKTGQEQLIMELKSNDKNVTPTGGQLIIDVEIEDVSFMKKCGIILLLILIALVLLWYIFGLFKKDRFAKGSEMVYYRKTKNRKGKEFSYGLPTNFFNRYLIPYLPEKRNIEGITFQAGKRSSYIFLPKKEQADNMYISGNNIEYPKQKDVRISKMEVLEIVYTKKTDNYRYNVIR